MEGRRGYNAGETLCPYKKFVGSNRKPKQLRVFGFVSVKTQLFLVFFNIS